MNMSVMLRKQGCSSIAQHAQKTSHLRKSHTVSIRGRLPGRVSTSKIEGFQVSTKAGIPLKANVIPKLTVSSNTCRALEVLLVG